MISTASKPLHELLSGFAAVPTDALCVSGLCSDSREIKRDELFVAVRGAKYDGVEYIPQAVERGAAAIVFDAGRQAPATGAPNFAVAELQQNLGTIAARFFDAPSKNMRVIGITGTNGKTTCAYLLAQASRALGEDCAFMGTLGCGTINKLRPTPLTTLDAIQMQSTLNDFSNAGLGAVCLEASSHGLSQGRVGGVEFNIAVLTNLSQDHLDYHGDMNKYAAAKQKLFEGGGLDAAIFNMDDAFGQQLFKTHKPKRVLGYGINNGDLRARNIKLSEQGISFDAVYGGQGAAVQAKLVGALNVPNLLAVIGTLLTCEYKLNDIAAALNECKPPRGRMEFISAADSVPKVVVDFAHTPHALHCALSALQEICAGKVWVVFGCGGDRDRDKRSQMGRIADKLADHIILTDDNPRSEDSAAITSQIAAGISAHTPQIIHDRELAINTAVAAATPKDFVLVAGKGHEATQEKNGRRVAMDDRDMVAAALAEFNSKFNSRGGAEL